MVVTAPAVCGLQQQMCDSRLLTGCACDKATPRNPVFPRHGRKQQLPGTLSEDTGRGMGEWLWVWVTHRGWCLLGVHVQQLRQLLGVTGPVQVIGGPHEGRHRA